jgi:hypothetical protein
MDFPIASILHMQDEISMYIYLLSVTRENSADLNRRQKITENFVNSHI